MSSSYVEGDFFPVSFTAICLVCHDYMSPIVFLSAFLFTCLYFWQFVFQSVCISFSLFIAVLWTASLILYCASAWSKRIVPLTNYWRNIQDFHGLAGVGGSNIPDALKKKIIFIDLYLSLFSVQFLLF